jgi:hypothetical protein
MFRRLLGAAGAICTASVIALAIAGSTAARTPHRPCPNANGGPYTLHDGRAVDAIHNLPDRIVYEHYAHYRQCAHLRAVAESRTEHLTVECRPGFKLAGTSHNSHDAHRAHWDFFANNGEWVTWNGFGHFTVHSGWATGYTAQLHNFNDNQSWWVMMFATCDRIPDYHFGD